MGAISDGKWSLGKTGGTVVTDNDEVLQNHSQGHGDKEYYGGYLIAESILKIEDAILISAAKDLLDACIQWKAAESMGDLQELQNAKSSRDAAIKKALGNY